MNIISINIQKGGCGKSTTTAALASGLKAKNFKVLSIDLDPQGNLSYSCGVESAKNTIYEVMRGELTASEAIIRLEDFDIIPSNILLSGAEQEFTRTGREYILKGVLESVQNKYDFILIDTPPSLGILTVNSLTCANYTLIPSEPSIFALQGLGQLYQTIQTVKKYCNKDLEIIGLLLVKYGDQFKFDKAIKKLLDESTDQMGIKIFDTKISAAKKVMEAQGEQKTLKEFAPKSKPFNDYMKFTDELLGRLER
jgi:chromosome partitioning protein